MSEQILEARVAVLQPPPIQGLSSTGGFDFMIEDREGKGIEATASVAERFLDAARARPELAGVFTTFSAKVPQLRFDVDRVKARRLDVPVSDIFSVLQTNLGSYYVNDFNLFGKTWKVMVQAESRDRQRPEDVTRLYVLNHQGEKVPLSALGEVKYALGPIDAPHYNMYNAAPDHRPARAGVQLGPGDRGHAGGGRRGAAGGLQLRVDRHDLPGAEDRQHGVVHLRPVDRLRLPVHGGPLRELDPAAGHHPDRSLGDLRGDDRLWLYDMPLDVFGQIGLVMLIGLETKNAILIVEFGVELMEKHGMGIIESAKEASRQRLRPILMTSFAFVFGVLPMAIATGGGAYSRNSLGVVIAFGIAISTVLERFVIPIYYVLGERLSRPRAGADRSKSATPIEGNGHGPGAIAARPSPPWPSKVKSSKQESLSDATPNPAGTPPLAR